MASIKSRIYEPPIILKFGPDMMEIGEELKVRCGGEGARNLENKHFVLMEKYDDFGVFESNYGYRDGYRKCFSWWDVARIGDLRGMVDNDFSVSNYGS